MLTAFQLPKTSREWQAVVGVDSQSFARLCDQAHQSYHDLRGCSYQEMLSGNANGNLARFKTLEDLIFYVLLMLKSGITFDLLGFISQIDHANAHRKFELGLDILAHTIADTGHGPYRDFDEVSHLHAAIPKGSTILLDGTEQRTQRPTDQGLQKDFYSGKKKSHTVKSLIISTPDRYIHFVSYCWVGRTHDFTVLKEEFPSGDGWFDDYVVRVDLGYLGFEKEYPNVKIFIPSKKPRKQELTELQKEENKNLAKERITVEHSIGGMKRYDFLSNTCRLHDWETYDKVLFTCAGLWNFFITR